MGLYVLSLDSEPAVDLFWQELWVIHTDDTVTQESLLAVTRCLPVPSSKAEESDIEQQLLTTPGVLAITKGAQMIHLEV